MPAGFTPNRLLVKQPVREAATICPAPCKLTFNLLILKVVPESRVTSVTSVPILVFLDLSVLYLRPMYATDVRRTSSLNAPAQGRGITTEQIQQITELPESRLKRVLNCSL